jgi:hypothetical protein
MVKVEIFNRDTGGGQNTGNTKKLRDRICVGYIERASAGNIECSSVLHSVVLMLSTLVIVSALPVHVKE